MTTSADAGHAARHVSESFLKPISVEANLMRVLILVFLSFFAFASSAKAGIILTVTQTNAGPINLGDDAIFNLFIRSSATEITNFGGIDFAVDAADPLGSATLTAGGQFTSGTSDFSPAFVDPFQLLFPTSFQFYSGNSNGVSLTLGTTDTLLATLTLSTVGATAGSYILGLTSVAASDTSFNIIEISNSSSTGLNYSIAAVPEPSLMFVAFSGIGLAVYRRRRSMANRGVQVAALSKNVATSKQR